MHGGAGAGEIERAGGEMRRVGGWAGGRFGATVVLLLTAQPLNHLTAQDTSHIVFPGDTMHRGVRPMGAFWRSFLLPGWGQAVTHRPLTGPGFVALEGASAMSAAEAQ